MRFEDYEFVAAIVKAHPRQTVAGRTRLQKTVRLLQRLGLPTSYRFTMHHFGPFSEALQSDTSLLRDRNLIEEEGYATQDGRLCYRIHHPNREIELPEIAPWREQLDVIAGEDAVILELAATYDSFRERGSNHEEALSKLREKKGAKCDDGREARGLRLLERLGLTAGE